MPIITDNNTWSSVALTSLTQEFNAASKIDMVVLSTQEFRPQPRVPGSGRREILEVAPDFDAPLDVHG